MSWLESFHDLIMIWLAVILILVSSIGYRTLLSPFSILGYNSVVLEWMWTLMPIVVLLTIVWPSVYILCMQDFYLYSPKFSIKVLASQWSWQSDLEGLSDHLLDQKLLDNSSSLEAPVLVPMVFFRLVTSSSDVLHSLGIPSLGVKLDAMPGRLNTTFTKPDCLGLIFGSCYELCGSGHSAMPISMLVY